MLKIELKESGYHKNDEPISVGEFMELIEEIEFVTLIEKHVNYQTGLYSLIFDETQAQDTSNFADWMEL